MSDIVTTQGAIITIDGDNDTAPLTISFVILPHVLPYPKERNMCGSSRVKRKGKACTISTQCQFHYFPSTNWEMREFLKSFLLFKNCLQAFSSTFDLLVVKLCFRSDSVG